MEKISDAEYITGLRRGENHITESFLQSLWQLAKMAGIVIKIMKVEKKF